MPQPTRRLLSVGPILAGTLVLALLVAGLATVWTARTRSDVGATSAGGIGGPFTLVDGDGLTVTDATFKGRLLLVYFGYTYCPDVCPTTLSAVGSALEMLGGRADDVASVFISVDPRRDTPAVVRRYAAAFSPRITGLTGSSEQIAAVARAYRVYYAEHRTGPGQDDYTMDHSSILYLMGPNGHFVTVIRADAGPDAIAAELSRHLAAT